MNFKITISTIVAALCFSGSAEARDTTRNYTCSGAKQLVARNGAIVLNTKNNRVYRRFVANRSYCTFGQVTKRYSVPTKSGRCSLKICIEYEPKIRVIIN